MTRKRLPAGTLFYLLLVLFCCAPVWGVRYFVNQDGSGHVYSSYLMAELLRGNPAIEQRFAFNALSFPNSSGHWLMVALLEVFSAPVVTKIMMTLTFAGFVASAAWLRVRTSGAAGLPTTLLFAAALGFNWLWLVGFYNFLIGVCCLVFAAGLYVEWRHRLTAARVAVLALFLLVTYISHIISFALLVATLGVLAISSGRVRQNIAALSVALLPVLPLLIAYLSAGSSSSGPGFNPVWHSLGNPWSLSGWIDHVRRADAFILISRRSFPFLSTSSGAFALFMPLVWIGAGVIALGAATLSGDRPVFARRTNRIAVLLPAGCIVAAMFAPDALGSNSGSVIRERVLLCGLVLLVPFFRAGSSVRLERIAQTCFAVVVVFQTAALWDYALRTDRQAREFLSIEDALHVNDRIASIVIVDGPPRFPSAPLSMVSNYLGFHPSRLVWDNYEMGHRLFPVVVRDAREQAFISTWMQSMLIERNGADATRKVSTLDTMLSLNQQKVTALAVWGSDPRVDAMVSKRFDPVFSNGQVRLFRPKR